MDFILTRFNLQPTRTIGEIWLKKGGRIGYTLEDRIRPSGAYVYGETAIPPGKYRMIISFSNRFQKRMIQLINVRGGNIVFGSRPIDQCGIRVHGGNTEMDTLGCPLLGSKMTPKQDKIYECKEVNARLFRLVEKADKKEEVYLTITNP